MNKEQAKAESRTLAWEYVWFGTVVMILELIPILSFLFLLTTSAATALWVARLEEQRKREAVETLVGEDVLPAYSDEAV